jgi:hypothetical protein
MGIVRRRSQWTCNTIRLTLAHEPTKIERPEMRNRPPSAITLIHQRGKFLCYVCAPDAETAIQEAIKHFEIQDHNSRDS